MIQGKTETCSRDRCTRGEKPYYFDGKGAKISTIATHICVAIIICFRLQTSHKVRALKARALSRSSSLGIFRGGCCCWTPSEFVETTNEQKKSHTHRISLLDWLKSYNLTHFRRLIDRVLCAKTVVIIDGKDSMS